jgi:hypothetical protein
MAALTKNKLLIYNIHNEYDIIKLVNTGIMILFYPRIRGRFSRPSRWAVVYFNGGKEKMTDKDAVYYDNYHKTFTIWNKEEKEKRLDEAINWCKEKFEGNIEFEKGPFNSWYLKGMLEKLQENLTEK